MKSRNSSRQKSEEASPRGGKRVKFHRKVLSKKSDFSRKTIKNIEILKMTSKVLYELLLKRYDEI